MTLINAGGVEDSVQLQIGIDAGSPINAGSTLY